MSEIQKISVALTTEQLNAIEAAVDTGEYATTSEIMREAFGNGSGGGSCVARS